MCPNTDTETCFLKLDSSVCFSLLILSYTLTTLQRISYGNTAGTKSKVKISNLHGFEPIVVAYF